MRGRDVLSRKTGRPKTKFYITLMARLPLPLADQVKAYATQHRLTISAVIRLGLGSMVSSTDQGKDQAVSLIPIIEGVHDVHE